MSYHRKKMSRHASRRNFSHVAMYVHPMNAHKEPFRGGFRL
jgi:hypothetical protein